MKQHQEISTINRKKEIDRETYERIKETLSTAESQLAEIRSQLSAIRRNDGSNLQESPSFLYLVSQDIGKQEEINRLKHELSVSIVVENLKRDDIVCIGDKVCLSIYYPEDDETVEKVAVLVGGAPNPLNDEISKSSPIGSFINGKVVGTSGNVVLPSGEVATVSILSKK